jgi:threonylcarbamoyladenosine tRNA methylthiotransferase CDKAL1
MVMIKRGPAAESISHESFAISNEKKKVWIEAYGCTASKADSEMIAGLLENNGYKIACNEDESSINLIVTCSVKDVTEHKMLYRIDKLSKLGKPIVVAGCLPKADRHRVESLSPSASLLGPHSIDRTIDVVNLAISGQKKVILEDSVADKINIPKIRLNPIISIVEIASGCMSECTFCQTKLAKGWIRSYRIGDIMRQIQNDIDEGCKEIWLSSTDNGCYGKDIGSDLVELLTSSCKISGNYKIRVGMMNPMYLPNMIDELVKVYANNDKIFKFLHIPVQSGSDRILRKMKRGHTVKIYRDAVKAFRSKMPEMTIATDIIVGFPSETEEDFQQTLALLKETEPDIVNCSKYSARPKTQSAKLKQTSSNIVKQRAERLHLISKEIGTKRNSLWNGWTGEIIIEEINDNNIQGRNYAYKPVIVSYPLSPYFPIGTKIVVRINSFSNSLLKSKAQYFYTN